MTQQTFTCQDQPDLTIPLDTIVPAKLTGLKLDSYEWDGKTVDKLIWHFEVQDTNYTDSQGNKRVVRGQTTARLTNHPNNRFRQWAESLLNRDIPVNMQLSTEDLVGLACKITVTHEKDRKNPGVVWDRVDEVLPAGDFDAPPF